MRKLGLFTVFFVILSCTPKPLAWMAIGDSITYLNEHPDETGNRITKGYMSRVVEELPHIRYINKGFNGWTAADVAGKIETLCLEARALVQKIVNRDLKFLLFYQQFCRRTFPTD